MNVLCILENGFEELEAIAPIDLLRRSGIAVDVYSSTPQKVISKGGIVLTDLLHIDAIHTDYDCLLLPGGPHYSLLESNHRVLSLIHEFWNTNKIIAAICAAPTILGRMGLLKNRKYTCFPPMNEEFGGTFVLKSVVRDSNLITARAAGSAIDFGLEILKSLQGKAKSDQISLSIYFR